MPPRAGGNEASPLPAQSVPRNSEEGRALLQARLCMLSRFAALVTLVFGFLGGAVMSAVNAGGGEWQWNATLTHLSSALVFGAIWLFTRKGEHSLRLLSVLDLVLVLSAALTFVMMGWQMPASARPDTLAIFSLGQTLVVRAVFIPSSPRRSALISSLCALPVVLFTYVFYSEHLRPEDAPGPFAYAYFATVLAASIVVVSSISSYVVYGLSQKVREARELGQYTLLEKIGEGGMGVVYRARHAMLRRPTAVKLLARDHAGEENLLRFEREAQLTSLLAHPNTVHVYDFGRTPDGVFYYAMEYLDGIDLESLVREDGPQPAARVVHLLLQVVGALAEAHAIGLIHRDIKPQNLLLCERAGLADVIKVVDFGLVKALNATAASGLSTAHQMIGTPLYMSPEAIVAPDTVDARSDLYALGAVAYYLLSGSTLFDGRSIVEICGHHLHTRPEAPSTRLGRELPSELEALVLECLAKNAAQRPADAVALRTRLLVLAEALPWTETDARRWWRERGDALRARLRPQGARAAEPSASRPLTVAVDFEARAEPSLRVTDTRMADDPRAVDNALPGEAS